MNRKEIYHKTEQLMDTFCDNCFLYKYHSKEKNRAYAHRFCITDCTVGEKIKIYGRKLLPGRENEPQ